MPLKLCGNTLLQTAATAILYGCSPVSYSVWMRIDDQTGWVDQNRQMSNGGYNHTYLDISSGGVTFRSWTHDDGGTTYDTDFQSKGGPIVHGRPYHVAMVTGDGNPRLYIDGRLVFTTSQPGTEGHYGWNSAQPFLLGCYDGLIVSFQDPAVWVGYGLSQSDVIALRDRTKAPGQVGTSGSLKWWLKLDGTAGNTASVGDSALTDQSASGFNITSIVKSYDSGGGPPVVAPVYTAGTMTYSPPAEVSSAFVTPSRQGIVFFFSDTAGNSSNLASLATNPTLTTPSLNGGAPLALSNGIWGVTQPAYSPFLYYPLPGTLAAGDSPTVSAPDAWAVTAAGPTGPLAGYAIDNSGKSIMPPFDAGPKTMGVGYNAGGPLAYWSVISQYSNFAKRIQFWDGANAGLDPTGHPLPTGGSGPSTCIVLQTGDNTSDNKGVLSAPPGTWTVMWDGPGLSPNDPTKLYITLNSGGEPSTYVAPPTLVSVAPAGQTQANNKITQVVSQDQSVRWSPSIYLQVNANPFNVPFTNLRIFPPGFDENSPTFHPSFLEKLASAKAIRVMSGGGGDGSVVDFSDFHPDNYVGYSLPSRYPGGSVVSVGPTSADTQKYFPGGASALITFASPHGYKRGNKVTPYIPGPLPSVDGTGVGAFPTNTGDGLIELSWYSTYPCVVIDDYNVAMPCGNSHTTSTLDRTYYAPTPHPTDGSWACSGPAGDSCIPPGQHADLCNVVGCDLYFSVPPAATDACVASTFDLIASRLAPGRKVYMEYGNEVWNYSAPGITHPWCAFNASHEGIGYLEWYTKRYGEVFAIAKARMVAAGRGGDILGVLGVQSANAGGTTAVMVNYANANGIPVDRVAIAPYFSNRDTHAPNMGGEWSLAGAWDAMNPEQIMDLGELHVVYGHVEENVAANFAYCGPGKALPNAKLICYEGGPEEGLMVTNLPWGPQACDRKQIWSRHPRFRGIMLHYLQILQDNGVDLFYDFLVGCGSEFAGGWSWNAYYAWDMKPGRGDGSDGQYDNRISFASYPAIHWDYSKLVSVVGGAINRWNSLVPAPTVTGETPAPGATGVATTALVMATFSTSVRPGSITLTLTDPHNAIVPGMVSYSDATHTVTLAPTGPLSPSTAYIATLSGATDQAGNAMAGPVTWSFTTAAKTVSSWTQTTAADFGKGINNGTTVTNTSGGQVQLAPTLSDDFDGSRLGPAWTSTPLESSSSVVVSGGILKIRDAQVFSKQASSPAPAKAWINFGAALYQDFGLATGLSTAGGNYWAVFGTKDSTNILYARVNVSGNTSIVNLGAPPTGYHAYEVAPVPGGFAFSIDGVVKATLPASVPSGAQLRVAFDADQTSSQPPMQIDWVRLGAYVSSGTFTSSVFDAGRTAIWGTASWTANAPIGTSLIVETSSGNTATPNSTWSAWAAVSNGGTVASPAARYIHYRLRLATSEPAASPIFSDIIIRWS